MNSQAWKLSPKLVILLFLTIFIEGYVVLASELIAIRVIVPFVGNDTSMVAIIISAVLLPLAAGYWRGGILAEQFITSGKHLSFRKKLCTNIAISCCILSAGLSYSFLEFFFLGLEQINITMRLVQTALYAIIFLVIPIYFLGQTTPLVSSYFRKTAVTKVTSRVLFFSTIGSFAGALISSLFLMHLIGVHHTVMVTLLLLVIPLLWLNKQVVSNVSAPVFIALAIAFLLNSQAVLSNMNVVLNNGYHTVAIEQDETSPSVKTVIMNRGPMSRYSDNKQEWFPYVRYIEDHILTYLPKDQNNPKNVLVIGAGAFTMGLYDHVNHYDFIDIDGALKDVAESHVLPEKLGPNKHFIVKPARAFLKHTTNRYDVVILDTYYSHAIPFQLVTEEYLRQVKATLNPRGVVVANILATPAMNDKWSKHFDATFRNVFGHFNRQAAQPFNPFTISDNQGSPQFSNIIYTYYHQGQRATHSYTDLKNDYFLHR